jgi:hypothetical protein
MQGIIAAAAVERVGERAALVSVRKVTCASPAKFRGLENGRSPQLQEIKVFAPVGQFFA